MKHVLLMIICVTLLFSLGFGQTYVGPEKCLMCHNNSALGDATGWRTSMHANGYSVVLDDAHSMQDLFGMINDYDQNGIDDFKDGLDFNAISSAFDVYKPNAPILSYNNGYFIQIGQVTHQVFMTYGGSGLYKQRYMVKINTASGNSAGYYVSPIQYNEKTDEYVLYHAGDWYDGSNLPIYTPTSTLADAAANSRSLAKQCAGCHSNGLAISQDTNGEWLMSGAPVENEALYAAYNNVYDIDGDGDLDQINTTCERCHGPGSDHAAAPTATNIINPQTDLTPEQANNLCGMCHSRGKSKPNNTFGFPFDDANMLTWSVGDLLEPLYTDGGGYWGDGINSVQHHQQFYDFYKSIKPTFAFHEVTCFECHDVHNTEVHHLRTDIEEEDSQGNPLIITVADENNTLCLACHATHGDFEGITKEMVADYANNVTAIGAVVQSHTKHPYDPENTHASRCSGCHLPKVAKSAVAYDIASHTFEAIPPQNTLDYQMPNSCALCHNSNTYGEGVVDTLLATWSNPEDTQIAEWANLYFDMFTSTEKGGLLSAKRTTTAPVLDGLDTDAAWATAPTDTVNMVVQGVHESAMSVQMKAVYDNTDIYILARWADPNMTVRRQELVYDGVNWVTPDSTNAVREDRIGIFWPMTEIENFESRGCMATCHNTRERWGKYVGTGEVGDMWHSKGARSWPAGYVDDKYVNDNIDFSGDGGRHGDASGSTFCYYNNLSSGTPQWMGSAHNSNPLALYDNTYTSAPWPGTWAVQAQPYDPNAGWQVGDKLPKYVMKVPDAGSARADIRIAPKWENGFWTVEIKRALDTADPDHDVIFSDLTKEYPFAVALIDNGTQPASSGIYPNLHAHQGINFEVLRFEEFVNGLPDDPGEVVNSYELAQNYPNPFNPNTTIKFSLAKTGNVQFFVYNLLGQKVASLVDGRMTAGKHSITVDGSQLSSGVYFYRLISDNFMMTKKMILIK